MKYIFVILFSLLYSINNYNNLFSIIIVNVFIILLSFLIFYKSSIKFNNRKNLFLSIIITFIISLIVVFPTIKEYKNSKLIIKNSNHHTVITDIYIDNVKIKTNHEYIFEYDRFNPSKIDTEYKKYTKTSSKYKLTLKPNEIYKIDIKNKKKIEIQFQRDKKDYSVKINDKKIYIDKYESDLNDFALQIYNSNFIYKYNNIINLNIIKSLIVFILIFVCNLYYIYSCINERTKLLYYLPLLILEVNSILNISILTKIIVLICYTFFILNNKKKYNLKNTKERFVFIISSLIISFSFLGGILLEKFNLNTFILYIILAIWIHELELYIIKKINSINFKRDTISKNINYHKIIVFLLLIIIELLYQFIFNPYLMTTDGYMQILEIEKGKFSNWHPYSHTLLMSLFKNLKYFIYFRIFVYSFIVTKILFYFNLKGMKLRYVYLISILCTIFPITGIYLVTIVKDVDFTICFILLTFLLYLIIKDFKYFNENKLNYIFLILSILGVGLFRHNGLIVIIITLLIFLIYSIKKKQKLFMYSLIIVTITLFIFKVPIYKKLNIKDYPTNFNIATMLHGFNYLIYDDSNKIEQSTYKYLTNKVTKEEWKNLYDKYDIDLMLHYSNSEIRYLNIDNKKIIFGYMKQFLYTPIELIKDRLYGTNLIWKVNDNNIKVYKYGIYDSFDVNYAKKLNITYNKNLGSNIVNKSLTVISNNEILNSMFFRTGLFFDLLIILILYSVVYKKNTTMICLIPFLLYLVTLFVALHHQEYRYVWNIEIIVCMYFMFIVLDNDIN